MDSIGAHGLDMVMTKKSNFEVVLSEKMGMSRFSRIPFLPVLPYVGLAGLELVWKDGLFGPNKLTFPN